jgi:ATP-dependent Clp protease adapter protein ClpS
MEKELENKPVGNAEVEVDEEITVGLECRVVLFNDDWHTFDEVIFQLIKAINCSYEKARKHAFEVHIKGKSIVFNGQMKDCLKVSSILEEIALTTQIIS